MSNITVILVDDHEMVRMGLKSFLNLQQDVDVIGEASNGREGVELALALRPDVVVMDLVMPELGGVEATLEILSKWKEARRSEEHTSELQSRQYLVCRLLLE